MGGYLLMKNLKINDFLFLFLICCALWLMVYFVWYGRGLPPEKDLHYVTGKVRLVTVAKDKNRDVKHMSIFDPHTKQKLVIGCGNAVYPKKDIASSCILRDDRLSQILTIGYYYQPAVLGITNEIPQMATIHINQPNGEMIVVNSYASTKKDILSANCFFFISFLFLSIFIIWCHLRDIQKELKNKEQKHDSKTN